MPEKQILRKEYEALKSLPEGLNRPDDGDWVVMSAEIPPEEERGGDVVRISGMKIPQEMPLLAQHLRHGTDGSPTVIGKIVETADAQIPWSGKNVPAKLGRFVWAPGELAAKYKALWPEFINRVSIGAMVHDAEPLDKKNPYGGIDYKQTELFELSIVTIPANPSAGAMKEIRQSLGDALDPDVLCGPTPNESINKWPVQDDEFDSEPSELEPLITLCDQITLGLREMKEMVKETHGRVHEIHGEVCGGSKKKSVHSRLDDIEDTVVAASEGAEPKPDRKPQQPDGSAGPLRDALQSLLDKLPPSRTGK